MKRNRAQRHVEILLEPDAVEALMEKGAGMDPFSVVKERFRQRLKPMVVAELDSVAPGKTLSLIGKMVAGVLKVFRRP